MEFGTGKPRAQEVSTETRTSRQLPAFLHRSPTSVGCATLPGCLPSTSPSLKYCCSALLCSGLVLAYEHSPVVMMCREGGCFFVGLPDAWSPSSPSSMCPLLHPTSKRHSMTACDLLPKRASLRQQVTGTRRLDKGSQKERNVRLD